MTGLPVLYFSNEHHIIPQTTVKNPHNQAPLAIRILKTYYKPHVVDIQREYLQVKTLGSATADEWLKGLDGRGQEQKNDAARWEKWETSGGVARMRMPDPELHEVKRNVALASSNTPTMTTFPAATNGHITSYQIRGTQFPATTHGQPQVPHPILTSFRKWNFVPVRSI